MDGFIVTHVFGDEFSVDVKMAACVFSFKEFCRWMNYCSKSCLIKHGFNQKKSPAKLGKILHHFDVFQLGSVQLSPSLYIGSTCEVNHDLIKFHS